MTGDNLRDYECPEEWLNACNADCSYRGKCVVLSVFRAHIALRADMRKLRDAVLGDMTAPGPYTIKAEAWDGIA